MDLHKGSEIADMMSGLFLPFLDRSAGSSNQITEDHDGSNYLLSEVGTPDVIAALHDLENEFSPWVSNGCRLNNECDGSHDTSLLSEPVSSGCDSRSCPHDDRTLFNDHNSTSESDTNLLPVQTRPTLIDPFVVESMAHSHDLYQNCSYYTPIYTPPATINATDNTNKSDSVIRTTHLSVPSGARLDQNICKNGSRNNEFQTFNNHSSTELSSEYNVPNGYQQPFHLNAGTNYSFVIDETTYPKNSTEFSLLGTFSGNDSSHFQHSHKPQLETYTCQGLQQSRYMSNPEIPCDLQPSQLNPCVLMTDAAYVFQDTYNQSNDKSLAYNRNNKDHVRDSTSVNQLCLDLEVDNNATPLWHPVLDELPTPTLTSIFHLPESTSFNSDVINALGTVGLDDLPDNAHSSTRAMLTRTFLPQHKVHSYSPEGSVDESTKEVPQHLSFDDPRTFPRNFNFLANSVSRSQSNNSCSNSQNVYHCNQHGTEMPFSENEGFQSPSDSFASTDNLLFLSAQEQHRAAEPLRNSSKSRLQRKQKNVRHTSFSVNDIFTEPFMKPDSTNGQKENITNQSLHLTSNVDILSDYSCITELLETPNTPSPFVSSSESTTGEPPAEDEPWSIVEKQSTQIHKVGHNILTLKENSANNEHVSSVAQEDYVMSPFLKEERKQKLPDHPVMLQVLEEMMESCTKMSMSGFQERVRNSLCSRDISFSATSIMEILKTQIANNGTECEALIRDILALKRRKDRAASEGKSIKEIECLKSDFEIRNPDAPRVLDEDSVSSSGPNESTSGSIKLPPCRVCGCQSTGFHYGVNSCEQCYEFFRRCHRKTNIPKCPGKKACSLVYGNGRGGCRSCKLKRCYAAGMSRKGIKTGRYSKHKRLMDALEVKSLHLKESQIEDIVTMERFIDILEKVALDFKEMNVVMEPARLLRLQRETMELYKVHGPSLGMPLKHGETVTMISEEDRVFVTRALAQDHVDYFSKVTRFAKHFPGYSMFSIHDQCTLVRRSWLDLVSLGAYRGVNQELSCITLPDFRTFHFEEYVEITNVHFAKAFFDAAARLKKLELTDRELVLVKAISLTTTENTILDFRKQPDDFHWYTIRCLQHELGKRNSSGDVRSVNRAREVFTDIIEALTFLREMNQLFNIAVQTNGRLRCILKDTNFALDVTSNT